MSDATFSASAIIAMSGGVDSSLAAALLVEQGYQVTGVTMHLWACERSIDLRASSCCSLEAGEDARRVCQMLGIPHYVFNFRQEFGTCVVQEFAREYERGRTPNPCLACNREIKFRLLLNRAQALGARYLATGHYARILPAEEGGRPVFHLLRGVDRRKDQSYVLYMLGQEELAHLLFPLGEMNKAQVRREAERRGLPNAGRRESQEICFIPDDDYRRFLAESFPEIARPGPIREVGGRVLGTHQGLPYYTVGQRKGLGLSGYPRPLFVIAIDAADNALIVGPEEALFRTSLDAEQTRFVDGGWPAEPQRVEAQVRYRTPAAPGRLFPGEPARARLEFASPQRAITPGQAVVFYRGERVLGGGIIAAPVP